MKKKVWVIGLVVVILVALSINMGIISKIKKEKDSRIGDLQEELKESEALIKEQGSELVELREKVELAKPWFELAEKEKQEKIQKQKAKEEAEEAEAKKKAEAEEAAAKKKAQEEADEKERKEAEALKKQEEEEKKGYETGITYDQLARSPDDHDGGKIKFSGKVVQVMEGDGETQIRIAVNNNYDTILYGVYDSSLVDSRILEDDMITVMGLSAGLLSYESTMGGKITIPSMLILQVEQ